MYHYNTNSPAIATNIKTRDGKTFQDVEHLFDEPFPAEDHKHFKVGYDKNLNVNAYYIYVPWQKVRDRLNAIVGKECWNLQVVGYFQDEAGTPIFCGRMTILGVTKEGLGFGKAKENWQGSKSEIAYADLFKNCAEQFGFCAYLDDQGFTIEHLFKSRDQLTRAMAQQLLPFYQKKQQQIREELGLPTNGNMLASEKERRQQKSKPRNIDEPAKPTRSQAVTETPTVVQTEEIKPNDPDFVGMMAWLQQALIKTASYKVDPSRINKFCQAAGHDRFESLPLKSKQALIGKLLQAFLSETERENPDLHSIASNFSQMSPDDAAKSVFNFMQLLQVVEQF